MSGENLTRKPKLSGAPDSDPAEWEQCSRCEHSARAERAQRRREGWRRCPRRYGSQREPCYHAVRHFPSQPHGLTVPTNRWPSSVDLRPEKVNRFAQLMNPFLIIMNLRAQKMNLHGVSTNLGAANRRRRHGKKIHRGREKIR